MVYNEAVTNPVEHGQAIQEVDELVGKAIWRIQAGQRQLTQLETRREDSFFQHRLCEQLRLWTQTG